MLARLRDQRRDEPADAVLQTAARGDHLLQRLIEQVERMAYTGKEKRLFIIIIFIDHTHTDAGFFCHVRNGRRLKAAACKLFNPGLQDCFQRRLIQFLIHTASRLT